ncbi:MAG: hypothetical protein ACXWQQ_14865, partial [Pseudobdellovibrio sp.]
MKKFKISILFLSLTITGVLTFSESFSYAQSSNSSSNAKPNVKPETKPAAPVVKMPDEKIIEQNLALVQRVAAQKVADMQKNSGWISNLYHTTVNGAATWAHKGFDLITFASECNKFYGTAHLAGVQMDKIYPPGDAKPTCSRPGYSTSCSNQTRVDLNQLGTVCRMDGSYGSFVCLDTNAVPQSFQSDLCNSANAAGVSSYVTANGGAYRANPLRSTLTFKYEQGQCQCAPRGFENQPGAEFKDCSSQNPYSSWSYPDDGRQNNQNNPNGAPGGKDATLAGAPGSPAPTQAEIQQQLEQAFQTAKTCIDGRFTEVTQSCATASGSVATACADSSAGAATATANPAAAQNASGQAQVASAVNNFNSQNSTAGGSKEECFRAATLATQAHDGIQQVEAACSGQVSTCHLRCHLSTEDVNSFADACQSAVSASP